MDLPIENSDFPYQTANLPWGTFLPSFGVPRSRLLTKGPDKCAQKVGEEFKGRMGLWPTGDLPTKMRG